MPTLDQLTHRIEKNFSELRKHANQPYYRKCYFQSLIIFHVGISAFTKISPWKAQGFVHLTYLVDRFVSAPFELLAEPYHRQRQPIPKWMYAHFILSPYIANKIGFNRHDRLNISQFKTITMLFVAAVYITKKHPPTWL